MANIDLSSYNLSELKGLQHDIENEIKAASRVTWRKHGNRFSRSRKRPA